MGDLKKIVIPEVKAHWEDLAYSMKYTIPQVTAIEKDRDLKDLDDRCTKLFKDWLTTNNGCKPKTWQTLLERIEYVNELYAAAERIKKTLGVK